MVNGRKEKKLGTSRSEKKIIHFLLKRRTRQVRGAARGLEEGSGSRGLHLFKFFTNTRKREWCRRRTRLAGPAPARRHRSGKSSIRAKKRKEGISGRGVAHRIHSQPARRRRRTCRDTEENSSTRGGGKGYSEDEEL